MIGSESSASKVIGRGMENMSFDIPAENLVKRTYVVLGAEVLGQRSRHDLTPDGRRGGEVRLARLAARGRVV